MTYLGTLLQTSLICRRLDVTHWRTINLSQLYYGRHYSDFKNNADYKVYYRNYKDQTKCFKKTLLSASNIKYILKNSSATIHGNGSHYKHYQTKQKKQTLYSGDRPAFSSIYEKKRNFIDKFNSILEQNSAKTWVNRTPESIRPYLELARADKPIGTLLLYFPCAFSICLAAPQGELPSLYYLGLFGIGAFLMRGAGCVINDLWDRDLDKLVDRTKDRPIASGKISTKNAIKLLAGQLTASLAILLSLNSTCILMGFVSMIPVVLYPLAKRYTYYPQAVLGCTFNVGALMGYTAVTGQPYWPLIGSLYASCICWTLFYDTIYAFQDVEDDEKAGIKSMALLFNKYSHLELKQKTISERLKEDLITKTRINTFLWCSFSAHLFLFMLAGSYKYVEGPVYLALVVSVAKILDQMYRWEPGSRQSAWDFFNSNKIHGLLLTLGIIASIYSQGKKKKPQNLSLNATEKV